jgi:hypothetical protein
MWFKEESNYIYEERGFTLRVLPVESGFEWEVNTSNDENLDLGTSASLEEAKLFAEASMDKIKEEN